MSEVDYSRFYYKREQEKDSRTLTPEYWNGNSSKKKSSKRPFLVLLIVIVIFGIIFFCVDFFSGGKLLDAVTAGLKGNTYEYYLVVTETGGRNLAYAKSLLIKQSGGSGYILDKDGKFLIVLAVYTEKSEASSVSAKNPNTYVYTMGFTSKNTKFYNVTDKAIRDIAASIKGLESGTVSESDCYGALLTVKGEILNLKSELLESGKLAELNILEYIIGSIDGLEVGKGTRLDFLSNVRYMLCGIVASVEMAENGE